MKDLTPNIAKSYDDAPYESFPFHQSHPACLFTLATVFGLTPQPIEKSRILELGCAAGGNIIPIAVHYPKANIIGIDFSKTEIKIGQEHIKAMQLNNIELRHQSILDFEKEEGLFDYIICHGVYSWVPDDIRESILKICNQNLSKNGVAYISYNTLPGWNMMNNIRDLMLWHTQNIEDPKTKVKQARSILKFITDGLEEDKSPYAAFLKQEIRSLEKQGDYYILHEHLSFHNKPFYFHEFMAQAADHSLAYLGDAILSSMYTDNLPKKFSEELHKVKNMIASNQYMDFIRNNRFRCTLLCHDDLQIQRSLKTDAITNFHLKLNAKPLEKFNEDLIQNDSKITFQMAGIKMSSSKPAVKQVLYFLQENRFNLISYDTLFQLLQKSLNKNEKEIHHILQVEVNLFRMALAGLIEISCYPSQYVTTISDKPQACPLARYQAKLQKSITNRNHQNIPLETIERHIILLLDGRTQISDIQKQILSKINNGELNILDAQKKPIRHFEPEQKEIIVSQFINKTLQRFCRMAVLIQ